MRFLLYPHFCLPSDCFLSILVTIYMTEQLAPTAAAAAAASREKKLDAPCLPKERAPPLGDIRTRSLFTQRAPEERTRPTQYVCPLTLRTLASSQAPGTLLPQHQISTSSLGMMRLLRSCSTVQRSRSRATHSSHRLSQ